MKRRSGAAVSLQQTPAHTQQTMSTNSKRKSIADEQQNISKAADTSAMDAQPAQPAAAAAASSSDATATAASAATSSAAGVQAPAAKKQKVWVQWTEEEREAKRLAREARKAKVQELGECAATLRARPISLHRSPASAPSRMRAGPHPATHSRPATVFVLNR